MATICEMTIQELQAAALDAPRQLSIACTQLAHAKTALAAGDKALAQTHYAAAQRAFVRAQEDERGQVARAEVVQRLVAEKGDAQDPLKPGGKDVVRLRAERKGATWLDQWTRY